MRPANRTLAGGRYAVNPFLGEAGEKRVLLANDAVQDRVVVAKIGDFDPVVAAEVARLTKAEMMADITALTLQRWRDLAQLVPSNL